MTDNWRATNLANWESRVPLHTGPDGYDVQAFVDPHHISDVVRSDLPRLGRLDGLDVVHRQCHIGPDPVSLAPLGARSVTGVDFSPAALDAARDLANRAGAAVTFIESDVYDAAGDFDLVYTGIGAICWLPDIGRWADTVARILRPGGRLFMRDGHPTLATLSDPRPDGLLVVEYPYFETGGTVFVYDQSYAGTGTLAAPVSVGFNHGLGEIFTALTGAGLTVTALEEHREVPWNALGEAMIPSPDFAGEFVLAERRDRIPLTFTIQAAKPIAGTGNPSRPR